MKKAWCLWYESQTSCVLLLNFRTFMETPFATPDAKMFLFPPQAVAQQRSCLLLCNSAIRRRIISVVCYVPTEMTRSACQVRLWRNWKK